MRNFVLLILFLAMINIQAFAFTPNANSSPQHHRLQNRIKKCSICRQAIEGRYWAYENGQNFCNNCYRRYAKCSSCGVPAKRGIRQGSKVYCAACVAEAPVCKYCNHHIFGRYWQLGSHNVCPRCHDRFPKCVRCGLLMEEYLEIEDKKICLKCSREVEYCARCQIPLLEYLYEFPDDERKFCADCVKSKHRCDICGKPIAEKYYEIGDKRKICDICMSTAVRNARRASEILQKVLRYLRSEFNMSVRLSTDLHLLDAQKLARVRGSFFQGHGRDDRRALGMFLHKDDRFEVYVESLLPYALCMAVMAHEYTHAWQADHFSADTSLLWLEGLAEWIAYKTLLHYGYEKEAAAITRQKDIYGQGFHKVLALERRYGAHRVLDKVKEIVNGR